MARNTPSRACDTADELLIRLAEAERDLWARGGVHGHQRRREILVAALAAGCTVGALARVLAVTPGDIRAWLPRSQPQV